MKKNKLLRERFESKVDRNGPIHPIHGQCWDWIGGYRNRGGYGCIGVGRKNEKASRVSWELYRGPIPDNLHVCHKCDRPACIRPEHLFLGSHADNMADRNNKNRQARQYGSENGRSTFSDIDITGIFFLRAQGYRQREIAACFRVPQQRVMFALQGRTWSHLGHHTLASSIAACYPEPTPCVGATRLTKAKVERIFSARSLGRKPRDIAIDFGCSTTQINRILNGTSWGHLGLHRYAPTVDCRPRGQDVATSKLRESDIASIFAASASGQTQLEIAASFGVSRGAVRSVLRGKSWKHLGLVDHSAPLVDGRTKLTSDDIRAIFAARALGKTLREIASTFAVSRVSIGLILRGKSWGHLGLHLSQPPGCPAPERVG